jgi:signal transduction histidine kinase
MSERAPLEEPQRETLTDKEQYLRRCIRELVAFSALPAVWAGRAPQDIAESLAEVLSISLSLEFAYVRVHRALGEVALEAAHAGQHPDTPGQAQVIGKVLAPWLQADMLSAPLIIPHPLRDGTIRLAVMPVGYESEYGVVAAASQQADFPTELDRLLLNVSANQVAIWLREARLVAALREANRLKDQALAREQTAHADLRQVAYSAAHDLQEPARTVGLYVQMLARRCQGVFDEEARRCMDFAIEGAARLQTQLNGLLEYVQVETAPKPFTATDCEAVFAGVLRALQSQISETGAIISHAPLPTLRATPAQLQLVFHHLLSNALKFCRAAQPQVHVWAERQPQAWRFAVRDNGIGIAPQHVEQIFTLFRRLHPRDVYPGAGVGLALCKKIVERHGGRIWIEPAPDQGTTVYFTINDIVEGAL